MSGCADLNFMICVVFAADAARLLLTDATHGDYIKLIDDKDSSKVYSVTYYVADETHRAPHNVS